MKHFDFEKAVKRYNGIMMSLCYEHVTIGTQYSEGTESWNIRDLVAECDYVLSCYYEVGHCNEELRHSEDPNERKLWYSETGKLRRFIDAYKPFIEGVICEAGHCSRYDNYKEKFWGEGRPIDAVLAQAYQESGFAGIDGKEPATLELE